jgi:electron transfer flavoprotein alpha subunit
MAGIYIYSDKNAIAAELIGFAKGAGQPARVIVFTPENAEALKDQGADQIFVLKGDSPIAENYGKAIAEFLRNEDADLFVVGATARGRDLAARVAGYLDCGMVSDVSSILYAEGKMEIERMIYGGLVVQKESLTGLNVATVPAGRFETISGNAEIVTVEVKPDTRVSLVDTNPIVKVGADLGVAEKVVCVGMGLEKEEDLQMVKNLAEALDAEIGCTRGIAEEKHWLPAEQYIGISGATIRPRFCLSLGVSGQVQHTIGIRDTRIIAAVNNNEKAPIFKVSDYGVVGDMYEIIPLLTEALKQ